MFTSYTHPHTFEFLPSLSITRVRFSVLEDYILSFSWFNFTIEFSW